MFLVLLHNNLQKPAMTAHSPKQSAWLNADNSVAKPAVTSTLTLQLLQLVVVLLIQQTLFIIQIFGSASNTTYTVNAVGYAFGTNKTNYTLMLLFAAVWNSNNRC